MSDFVAIQHAEKREMIFVDTIDDKSFTRIVVGCLCVLERLATVIVYKKKHEKGLLFENFLNCQALVQILVPTGSKVK